MSGWVSCLLRPWARLRQGRLTGMRRFADSPGVQTFVESQLELQSRRKHWDTILKKAEKEAFEAYLAAGRKRPGAAEESPGRSRSRGDSPSQRKGECGSSGGKETRLRKSLFGGGGGSPPSSRGTPTKSPGSPLLVGSKPAPPSLGAFSLSGSNIPKLDLSSLGGKV